MDLKRKIIWFKRWWAARYNPPPPLRLYSHDASKFNRIMYSASYQVANDLLFITKRMRLNDKFISQMRTIIDNTCDFETTPKIMTLKDYFDEAKSSS